LTIALRSSRRDDLVVGELITHQDLTIIMGLLGDIRRHVQRIRELLEDDGDEEESEADA
jgi:hypothetical protein